MPQLRHVKLNVTVYCCNVVICQPCTPEMLSGISAFAGVDAAFSATAQAVSLYLSIWMVG